MTYDSFKMLIKSREIINYVKVWNIIIVNKDTWKDWWYEWMLYK
jgi:hypothetical protein